MFCKNNNIRILPNIPDRTTETMLRSSWLKHVNGAYSGLFGAPGQGHSTLRSYNRYCSYTLGAEVGVMYILGAACKESRAFVSDSRRSC